MVQELTDREAQSNASEELATQSAYPEDAADYFGELYAHRLRWGHAVNSRRTLRMALAGDAHFLEADVAAGPLLEPKEPAALASGTSSGSRASQAPAETSVCTDAGLPVIMAHYPTSRSSDLSLENFVTAVLRHNALIDGEIHEDDRQLLSPPNSSPQSHRLRTPFSAPVLVPDSPEADEVMPSWSSSSSLLPHGNSNALARNGQTHFEEAAAFALDLTQELNHHAMTQSAMVMACVGTRRGNRGAPGSRLSKKGVKLDFKVLEAVEPSLRYLQRVCASQKLGGHLWLNADVFAGPGYPESLLSPMDARKFVRLCAELVPEAVLSLSWGSSVLSTSRHYSHDMVDRMIELCMTPFVPRPLASIASPREKSSDKAPDVEVNGPELPADFQHLPEDMSVDLDSEENARGKEVGGNIYLTPAASCHHITFAVAAEYALNSSPSLLKLLDAVPGSSLTLFSGMGSLGISPASVKEMITTYGTTRCFLDLRVTKPCRSCSQGGCSVQ